jgi:exopolysaccharide production protein ExoQ
MNKVARATAVAPQPANWQARFAAALAIGVGFWFVGHSLTQSRTLREEGAVSADRIENRFAVQQSETTTSSAVGYFVLGGLGLMCLASAARSDVDWRQPLLLFCAAYVGWCVVSMLWSVEPMQTFRKLAILGLMLGGAFGVASRFDLEDVIWIAFIALAGFVGLGLLAEVALGTFRPWRSDYRFAGTCHPNDQGLQCALLALAAGFAAWNDRDRPWVRRAVIALALIGLALSKSRTTLLALVVAAAVGLVLRSRGVQRWLVLATCLTVLCVGGILSTFVSVAALDQTADVAAMGRRENVNSLTGRLPLWHELWKAADERLLTGHGYGAFWGEKNVLKYSEIFAWHIPHGHNAYLDLVLAIGVVGGVLYVAWVLATALVAAVRHERTGRAAYVFVACLMILSLVHGGTESKFPGAGIGTFVLFTAIAAVTLQLPQAAIARSAALSPSTKDRRARFARAYHPQLAPALPERWRRAR